METKKHKVVPSADTVTFYASATKAVPVWRTRKSGSGWVDVYVGEFTTKSRHNEVRATINELLRRYYPGVKEIDVWSDVSYHSPLNQGKANKITKYGMEPNMVGISTYKKLKTYTLVYPVKSVKKSSFGKTKKHIISYIWTYLGINWAPGTPKKWWVAETVHYPDGRAVVKSKSRVFTDSAKARELFDSNAKRRR